jgi:isoquinoline 1-oxidoreductase subunit alpha
VEAPTSGSYRFGTSAVRFMNAAHKGMQLRRLNLLLATTYDEDSHWTKSMPNIVVNGLNHSFDGDPEMPLLWYLRDELNLTGTKFGCGMALCGACTVHLDGEPARACLTPIGSIQGRAVTTIESAHEQRIGEIVQNAWIEAQVPQCGYCQSGQIMSAIALLKTKSSPTDSDIDSAMSGNICRCGTYSRIRAAIHQAAEALKA